MKVDLDDTDMAVLKALTAALNRLAAAVEAAAAKSTKP